MLNTRTRILATLGCATVLLTATACGGSPSGQPTATSNNAAATTPAAKWPKHGAPDIAQPLDVSSLTHNPCDAITDTQVESFPGTLDETQTSPTTAGGAGTACGWIFDGPRYSYGSISGGIVPPTPTHHGLSSIYDGRDAAKVFRPIKSINGYPAVIYSGSGPIESGSCRMSVGLRNDTAYRIQTMLDADHPSYDKPCRMARKLAGYIVQNLKEAQ